MERRSILFGLLFAAACGNRGETVPPPGPPPEPPPVVIPGERVAEELEGEVGSIAPVSRGVVTSPDGGLSQRTGALAVEFMGVGGFAIRYGDDLVLTAPMFSNPPMSAVLGGAIVSDRALVERYLPAVDDAKAILVGHAHYDHLLDVPYTLEQATNAVVYGNTSTKRLLAALAPDRSPTCPTSTASNDLPRIARDRVVALDDATGDVVDYRLCGDPQSRCSGAWNGGAGSFVNIPNSNARLRGLCSSHPDQFLIFHFGIGCVDDEQCELPSRGSDWREGTTIAYLIDFLDPASGEVIFRVYYQDAPTDLPVGGVHPDLLAEKGVDLALLCVGSYDQVRDHPGEIIRALNPRYVIAGHWESFFKTRDEEPEDIPFLDVQQFAARLNMAMPGGGESRAIVDGVPTSERAWMPNPGVRFEFLEAGSP